MLTSLSIMGPNSLMKVLKLMMSFVSNLIFMWRNPDLDWRNLFDSLDKQRNLELIAKV